MQIPTAQAVYQHQETLVQDLLQVGATRVYSDYWTCNRLIFLSNERIICSVLNPDLSPGYNRYTPYMQIVEQSPHPAYVFDTENGGVGISQDLTFRQRFKTHYHPFYVAGFVIYLPVSNISSVKSRDFFAKR